MIGLSTTTVNTSYGSLIIKEHKDSGGYAGNARASRVATLDGGVEYIHFGNVAGDRDLKITSRLTKESEDVLKDMYENETTLTVCTDEGAYLCGIANLSLLYGELDMTLQIIEKVSQ